MKILILYIASIFGMVNTDPKNEIKISDVMSVQDMPSGNAYCTSDHLGNTVLCWTAGEKENSFLYYSIYNSKLGTFGNQDKVIPSKGTNMHGESMNKIAFKKDGTLVAVYERKHPTETNRFAGSIFYAQSFDQGKTWTKEKYLHTDTLQEFGHSYFDVATLPDGEVCAVWLDGRNQRGKDGSSLYFSKTKNKEGFQTDKEIGETVCQCCRTDLYVDQNETLHVLYRDIDNGLKGQIRDFVHATTTDNGNTFSSAKKISEDNWVIAGCPHTGASMCGDNSKIGIVWYTAGGVPGLYYTSSKLKENNFHPRQLLSEAAHHPQLTTWGKETALVWEEAGKEAEHDHNGGMHNESKGTIVFTVLDDASKIETKAVVDSSGGEFPALASVSAQEMLVAYTKDGQVWVKKVSR